MTTEHEHSQHESQQETEQPSARQQPPSSAVGAGLGQVLQQQIAAAIQPVIADFRQQMAHAGQPETHSDRVVDTNGKGVRQEAQQVMPDSAPEQPADGQPEPGPQPTERAVSQGHKPDEAESGDQQTATAPEEESEDQHGLSRGKSLVTGAVRPAVSGALHLVEEQGEQWLRSTLVAGLDALLSEAAHSAVQQRAEHGLQVLLQKAYDALPEGAKNEELRIQTERTMQAILRESLDAVFAEAVRADVREHSELAVRSLTHREGGAALQHAQQTLHVLVQEFVAVLRRQWQRILRLLLKLILTALEGSLSSTDTESLPDTSARSAAKQAEAAEPPK